jgi:kynurenine formamidase
MPYFTSLLLILLALAAPGQGLELENYALVDLSHSYNQDTLYWPTSPSQFEKTELSFGKTEGGWFYSAYSLCTPEHGGTHLDAPMHFAAEGLPTDQIPLNNLVLPGVVLDISAKADADPDYRLTAADVRAFEASHGRIEAGSAVLLRTGWSQRWPNAKAYLGDDTPGDASKLRFPSFGAEAARLLVEERRVTLLGVDTASIDYGKSQDFIVHRIAAGENVGGLENLTDLHLLPAKGFILLALPLKIEGGSGSPARVVAMVPKQQPQGENKKQPEANPR